MTLNRLYNMNTAIIFVALNQHIYASREINGEW